MTPPSCYHAERERSVPLLRRWVLNRLPLVKVHPSRIDVARVSFRPFAEQLDRLQYVSHLQQTGSVHSRRFGRTDTTNHWSVTRSPAKGGGNHARGDVDDTSMVTILLQHLKGSWQRGLSVHEVLKFSGGNRTKRAFKREVTYTWCTMTQYGNW